MNYTNYILNGRPLQPESFISEGRFRVVSIVVVIVPSLVGVVVISGMIPVALMIDGGRLIKLRYYQYMKAQRRERYLKSVMVSLGHSADEWYKLAA
jgi:hypothetical protein